MDTIIVAAGSGSRMGNTVPKQFININGKPVIYYTLLPFENNYNTKNIFVIISKQHEELYLEIKKQYLSDFTKLRQHIYGGERRQDSVYNGLKHIADNGGADLVSIHDAARPFLKGSMINELCEYALKYGGAAPGVEVVDTIKMIDENGLIKSHPVRSDLRAIQTPQIFKFSQLYEAFIKGFNDGLSVTDDTELFSYYGGKVALIKGDTDLFKITYPSDIEKAQILTKNIII